MDTEPEQTDVNKFVFNLLDPDSINHLVVFMTGVAPFDEGYGASIFLGWSHPEPSWQLLGFLTNDKPSAIFRIQKTKPLASEDNPFAEAGFAADGVGWASVSQVCSGAQRLSGCSSCPVLFSPPAPSIPNPLFISMMWWWLRVGLLFPTECACRPGRHLHRAAGVAGPADAQQPGHAH